MEPMTAATAGLFAAWAVHDVEEVFTLQETSRQLCARLPESVPVPDAWREHGLPRRQVLTGISVMGVVMAAAAADGYRTGGRSALYQTALLGFGLHGLGHLAMAAGLRGYASGAVTSATVVIPYWVAATRRLDAAEVPSRRSLPLAAAALPVAIWGAHGLAYLLSRSTRRDLPGRQEVE
jgi:hypothetical protein